METTEKTMKRKEMTGRVFGLLTVIEEADPYYRSSGFKLYRYKCLCKCGRETVVVGQNLRSGTTKSCGCRMGKYKHGHAGVGSRTYQTWTAMRARCNNPTHTAYPRYGGKGIAVCDEWNDPETGFQAFLEDMGERPEGLTLDRKDGAYGYSKANCRWATNAEQYENKKVVRDSSGRFAT